MDKYQIILAEIRARFGEKLVLYSEDLAEILGKDSVGAIYSLNSRGGLPVEVKEVGGRPCVSVFDVAEWLANSNSSNKAVTAKKSAKEEKPVAEPKRYRESLGKYLLQLRVQRNFLAELDANIEKLITQLEIDRPDLPSNADLGRDGRI